MLIIVISVSYFILQFLAWSFASGNTAVNMDYSFLGRLWPVLSFPIFWIAPKDLSNFLFWLLFCVNSIIWGLLGFLILSLMAKK
jgi:hypothetical protein